MTDEQVRQMWLEGQRNELATQLRGIAVSIAERLYVQSMRATDIEVDDVISWALEAMCKAIESWDPDSVPLRGWIAFKVPRDIVSVQRRAMSMKRGGGWDRVSMEILEDRGERSDDCDHDDGYKHSTNSELAYMMPSVRAEEGAAAARIDAGKVLENLPEYRRQILRSLASGASLREVGEALGISHEWVRLEAERARAQVRASLS